MSDPRWIPHKHGIEPYTEERTAAFLEPVPDVFDDELDFDNTSEAAAQADRRNTRQKMAAGFRGLKAAIRGDSSFFAHFYRGTLIAITAALPVAFK